ncbi:protein lines [Ischnura elegans]|uniref:protein lines n=1 Tax=Ischnura elegans TaxID=197161 RepID=UPI001ED89515|nr:protein lines [Ischnura elegans]
MVFVVKESSFPPIMGEPVRKKARIETEGTVDVEEGKGWGEDKLTLTEFQTHLLTHCLCSYPGPVYVRKDRSGSEEPRDNFILHSSGLEEDGHNPEWTRDHLLLFLATVQLLCETEVRQRGHGVVCPRLAEARERLVSSQSLAPQLIALSAHGDPFVVFAAGRALSALLLASRSRLEQAWLDALLSDALLAARVNPPPSPPQTPALSIQHSIHFNSNNHHRHQPPRHLPRRATFALDVLRRVVEWRDLDLIHPLEDAADGREDGPPSHLPGTCSSTPVTDPEDDESHVKCVCIKALVARWSEVVNEFGSLLRSFGSPHSGVGMSGDEKEAAAVAFLSLWEAIVAVKANLSVADTEPFLAHLGELVSLLRPSLPPVLWRHLLSLLNEVLCYGSTLALQDTLAEEPCALAHLVVRNVKDWRLLDGLPYRHAGGGRFGGRGAGDASDAAGECEDRPLLQKAVLLVLKSVAVTVKETRCESSSDDSSVGGMGIEEEEERRARDADLAVIERGIKEVLRRLDVCVKSLLPFHPEAPLAHWVVSLFSDQDDALVEGMVCCLDVAVGLGGPGPLTASSLGGHGSAVPPSLFIRRALSPSATFLQFLHAVSHDAGVLLDLLVSNETCFLLYLLRFLKFARRNWEEVVHTAAAIGRNRLGEAIGVLIRLRLAVERLVAKALFPYNINPVLRLLEKCEHLYEASSR